jgi:hypothetical protein
MLAQSAEGTADEARCDTSLDVTQAANHQVKAVGASEKSSDGVECLVPAVSFQRSRGSRIREVTVPTA